MKKSSDFYKVVNAVCNTISEQGGEVPYVFRRNGHIECGSFDCNDSNDTVRDLLLTLADCEELDEDELMEGFGSDTNDCEFWQLSNYGEGADCIQLAINPDNYVTSSYKLRDMIADDLDLESAEITDGMNGYPSHLRGCVLINDGKRTIDELKAISERYGVELVSLSKKAGWQLWHCEGWKWEMYDVAEYMDQNDDNLCYFTSWKEYAEALREWAENADTDTEALTELADEVEQREPMGSNEFVWVNTYDVTRYTLEDRMVDHFCYDSNYYTLAFDCMVEATAWWK